MSLLPVVATSSRTPLGLKKSYRATFGERLRDRTATKTEAPPQKVAMGSEQRHDRAAASLCRLARDPTAGALSEGCQVSSQYALVSGELGACRTTGEH